VFVGNEGVAYPGECIVDPEFVSEPKSSLIADVREKIVYSVDNIITWEEDDCCGFSGTLLRNGVVVGAIRDDIDGHGAYAGFIDCEEESIFKAHLTTLPDVVTEFSSTSPSVPSDAARRTTRATLSTSLKSLAR
jgi:hypothetical protein